MRNIEFGSVSADRYPDPVSKRYRSWISDQRTPSPNYTRHNQSNITANQKRVWVEPFWKRSLLTTEPIKYHSQSEACVGGAFLKALFTHQNQSNITANQKRVWAEPFWKRSLLTTEPIKYHSQSEACVGGAFLKALFTHDRTNQISQPIRSVCGWSLSESALYSPQNQSNTTANQKRVWVEPFWNRSLLTRTNQISQPIRSVCGRSLSESALYSRQNQSNITANQKRVWAEPFWKRSLLTTEPIRSMCGRSLSESALHSWQWMFIIEFINIKLFYIIKCTYWVTDNIFVMEYTRSEFSFNVHLCFNLFSRSEVNYRLISVWL